MIDLQALVEGYLESAGYHLYEKRPGFIVADRPTLGGDRDTRMLWITPPTTRTRSFSEVLDRLVREFAVRIPQFGNATATVVAHSRDGFSNEFLAEAMRLGIRLRVPIEFFDSPYRVEELPRAAASAIEPLRDLDSLQKRVPQPYSLRVQGEWKQQGDDLLTDILNDLERCPNEPCLRIVIGPAGSGKSVFFQALFALLYQILSGTQIKTRSFSQTGSHASESSSSRTGTSA